MKRKLTFLAALFSLLVSSVSAQAYLSVTVGSYDAYVGEDQDLEVEATVKNESATETLSNVSAWVKINGNEWGGSTAEVGELAPGESKKVKLTAKEIYFGSGSEGIDDLSELPSTDDDETIPSSFKLQVAASQYGRPEVVSEAVTVEYISTSAGDDDDSPYEVSLAFNMLKLNIPSKVQVGETITVAYSVATTYTQEGLTIHNAVVTLLANGKEVAKSDPAEIPQGIPHYKTLTFAPTEPGEVELTLVLTYDEIAQDKAGVHELTYGSKVTVEGSSTAISTVARTAAAASDVYTLQGQRLAAPAKGIVIVNGRKVIVK